MEPEIPEEVVDLPGIFTNHYYRQIEVINKSKTTKFAKLTFENQPNCNVILPKSVSYKLGFRNSEKIWFSKQVFS